MRWYDTHVGDLDVLLVQRSQCQLLYRVPTCAGRAARVSGEQARLADGSSAPSSPLLAYPPLSRRDRPMSNVAFDFALLRGR